MQRRQCIENVTVEKQQLVPSLLLISYKLLHTLLFSSYLLSYLTNLTPHVVSTYWKILPFTCNNYSYVYCSATITLYRINVAGNNKIYLGPHWKHTIFLSDFKQIRVFLAGFKTGFQYQFSRNSFKLDTRWYMRGDGRTRVAKLIVFFCGYNKALYLTP
jgi:hypothetical protein